RVRTLPLRADDPEAPRELDVLQGLPALGASGLPFPELVLGEKSLRRAGEHSPCDPLARGSGGRGRPGPGSDPRLDPRPGVGTRCIEIQRRLPGKSLLDQERLLLSRVILQRRPRPRAELDDVVWVRPAEGGLLHLEPRWRVEHVAGPNTDQELEPIRIGHLHRYCDDLVGNRAALGAPSRFAEPAFGRNAAVSTQYRSGDQDAEIELPHAGRLLHAGNGLRLSLENLLLDRRRRRSQNPERQIIESRLEQAPEEWRAQRGGRGQAVGSKAKRQELRIRLLAETLERLWQARRSTPDRVRGEERRPTVSTSRRGWEKLQRELHRLGARVQRHKKPPPELEIL